MSEMTIAPNGVDLTKLSLKDVKFHEDMSEETGCFSGLLLDDGVIVAHVSNNGQGGCNNYHPFERAVTNVNLYERYGQLDVDCHIMGLAEDWNVVTKSQTNKFVLKKGYNYYTVKAYSNGWSFAKLKKMGNYRVWLNNQIKRFEAEGYKVLNRNL